MPKTVASPQTNWVEVVNGLPKRQQEALTKVCEAGYGSEVYLDLEDQRALESLGLIELTPGRKSAKQPNKFAVAYDAKCATTSDGYRAWRLWYLETEIENPSFSDKVQHGWYEAHRADSDFMADLEVYACESGIPKGCSAKACSYAWEESHSSGYQEILWTLESIIEIFNAKEA